MVIVEIVVVVVGGKYCSHKYWNIQVCGEGGLAELYRGLPDLTDSSANGIAVAHMVWLWVLLKAFGLYEYCLERFANLESATKVCI